MGQETIRAAGNIWLASGNIHKERELSGIFAPLGFEIKLPAAAGIAAFDPPETGTGFLENSLIKARALAALLAERGVFEPVLADDSGLCVDALGGRPGIYSARYSGRGDPPPREGEKLSSGERNRLLLEELGNEPRRGACFVCAMVLLFDENRFACVQETLRGEIARGPGAGEGGFGYDPILYLPDRGCTVAELAEEEKNRISHRAKAGRAIAKLLACQN
ncbi:MAG: non-canonical purine NTP pyrophosphatase [Treponema sp.]|nr:non-canonical purine NTP pyrophosphatase [Treponema sp.]